MVESIVFNGITYRRYTDAKRDSDRKYFKADIGDQQLKGASLLHRDVWQFYNGPIPKGYQIHHKDGNTANNVLANLACLSRAEHLLRHLDKNKNNVFPEKAQVLATAWHRSEEGHLWHIRNSIEFVRKCPLCDKEFITTPRESGGARYNTGDHKGKKFCSRSCASKYNNAIRTGCIQPISEWDTYILCQRHRSS